ncbi:MAG: nucleotidyltransferase family protein [Fimbriimonadales bacterium]
MPFEVNQETRRKLESVCRKYAVRRLRLFGSAVGDEFDAKRSDLDFLVEFDAPPPRMRLGKQYFGLLEDMQELFGRKVDLLETAAIENSRLLRNAEASAVTLYAP